MADFIKECRQFLMCSYRSQYSEYDEFLSHITAPPTIAASNTTNPDPHAVSDEEAGFYYYGLHSRPRLLYRTGKRWSPPVGPEAYYHPKELCEVFAHPIAKVWNNDLAWKVVNIMDAHTIRFTTIDVVRFKKVDRYQSPENRSDYDEDDEESVAMAKAKKKPVAGPVTIWIGVFPESTTAMAAHNAAQDVLALLREYQITDVDIDYRESYYMRNASPQLLEPVLNGDPLVNVIGPLTPALGLGISPKASPGTQGTMALYLAEGGDSSNSLLGLSCRHVLIGSKEANIDYVHHPGAPSKDVLLLGKEAFTRFTHSIKLKIGEYDSKVEFWKRQNKWYMERKKGTNMVDAEEAKESRIYNQQLLNEAGNAMEELAVLHDQIFKNWRKLDNRVIGHILRSPAISLGVGEHHFTEDWAVFWVDRAKLGNGFQGNALNMAAKQGSIEFAQKCRSCSGDNWKFKYPWDCLLPLTGTLTDELMHTPDTWNSDGEPCLLVVKNGNATGTTLGRANGVFSIVREYFMDSSGGSSSASGPTGSPMCTSMSSPKHLKFQLTGTTSISPPESVIDLSPQCTLPILTVPDFGGTVSTSRGHVLPSLDGIYTDARERPKKSQDPDRWVGDIQ